MDRHGDIPHRRAHLDREPGFRDELPGALAGRVDVDLRTEPLGTGSDGKPVFLRDVWPTQKEVQDAITTGVRSEMFHKEYGEVFNGETEVATFPGDLPADLLKRAAELLHLYDVAAHDSFATTLAPH